MNPPLPAAPGTRIVFLDYLRVIACIMVIGVHAAEFFYVGPTGIAIRNDTDRFWVSLVDSAFRAAVPLFVMTSSYLLLPLQTDSASFFKRRFTRVLIPFIIWSILYAAVPMLYGEFTLPQVKENLVRLLWNFNYSSGHLWFIYMLIGLYLFMPILSPWLKGATRRGEEVFLALWFLTTFYRYAAEHLGDLYGACLWNEFHTFYYYSGYIGYLVLAHYIRTYIDWNFQKSLAIGLAAFAAGFAFTAIAYYHRTLSSTDYVFVELPWRFCTFNVALMTFGIFILVKKIDYARPRLYRPVAAISRLSYGIYLMHIFFLNLFYRLIGGNFSTPLTLLLLTVATFVTCCVVATLLSKLPGAKYYIG